MTNRPIDISPMAFARAAGVLYLIIIIAGIFAEFAVRSQLFIPGDPSATIQNITASEGLFRAGFVADLVMLLCDVAMALILYVLLKPVNHGLALLAAFFRLTQTAILGMNLLNHFYAIMLLDGSHHISGLGPDQLEALVSIFLDAHRYGYLIAQSFFGLHCAILGYLVWKSEYFPGLLGILLLIASVGYLSESFGTFLLPQMAETLSATVIGPIALAELSFGLWLLIRGIRRPASSDSWSSCPR